MKLGSALNPASMPHRAFRRRPIVQTDKPTLESVLNRGSARQRGATWPEHLGEAPAVSVADLAADESEARQTSLSWLSGPAHCGLSLA